MNINSQFVKLNLQNIGAILLILFLLYIIFSKKNEKFANIITGCRNKCKVPFISKRSNIGLCYCSFLGLL